MPTMELCERRALPHVSLKSTKAAEASLSQDEGLIIFEVTPRFHQARRHWLTRLTTCLKPPANDPADRDASYNLVAVMFSGRARNIISAQANASLEAWQVADPIAASALTAAARCAVGGLAFNLRLQVNPSTAAATLVPYLAPPQRRGGCEPTMMIQSCLLETEDVDPAERRPSCAESALKPAVLVRGIIAPEPPISRAIATVTDVDSVPIDGQEALSTDNGGVGHVALRPDGGLSTTPSGNISRGTSLPCQVTDPRPPITLSQRQITGGHEPLEPRCLGSPQPAASEQQGSCNSALGIRSGGALTLCQLTAPGNERTEQDERKDSSGRGTGGGVRGAEDVDPACLREIALDASPCLITVVRHPGTVLYQNAQSQAYFGDLRGQAANVILGLLLGGSNNGSDPTGAGGTWIPPVAKPMLEKALEAVSCGQSFSTVVQLPARLRMDVGEVGPVNTPGRGGETSWWVAGASTSLQPSQGGGEDSRGLPSIGELSSRLRSPVVDHVDRLLLAALESSDGGCGFGNNRGGGSPGLARRMHLAPQGPAKSSPNSYIFQTQQIVRHVGMPDKLLATTVAGSGGRGERVSGSGSQGHFPPRWDFVAGRRSNQDVLDCEDATTPHKRISYLQDANVSGGESVRSCGGGGDNADGNAALCPELMPQDGTSHHSEAEGDAGPAPWAKVDPYPTTQPMSLMNFASTGSKDCMRMVGSLPATYRPGVRSMTDATPDFQNSLGNYSFTVAAQGQQCGVSRWLQNNLLAPAVPHAGAAAVSSVGSSSVPAYAQGPPLFLPALSREPGRGLAPPSSGCTTPLHAAAPTLNTLHRLLGAAATPRKRAPLRRTVSVLPRPSGPSGPSGPSLSKATNLSPFQKLDEGPTHGFGVFGGAGSSASPVNTAPATLAPSTPVIPSTALQSLAVSFPTIPAAVAATVATASGAAHTEVATGSSTVVGGIPEAVAPVGCGIAGAGASGVSQRAVSTPHSTKLPAAPARRTRSILAPKVPVQPLSTLGRSTMDDVLAPAARAVSIDFMRPGSFLDDVVPRNCGNGPGHGKGTNADGDDGIGHHERQCCAAENSEALESCVEDSCIVGTIPVTPANAAVPVGDNGLSHPPPVVPRRGWIRGVSGGAGRAAGLSALLFAQGSTVGYSTVDSGKAHEAGSTASGAAGPDGMLLSSSASILTATLMSEFGSTDGNAMLGYARDGGGGEAGAAALAAGNASGSRSCHDAMPEASLGLWRPVPTGEPTFKSPPAAATGSSTDRAWTCLPTCGSNGDSKLHPPAPILLFHEVKAANTGGKNSSRLGGREGPASFPAVLAPANELVNAPTPDAAAAADDNNNAEEQAAAATVAPAAAALPPLSHAVAAVDGAIRIATSSPISVNGTNVLPQTASIAAMPLLQGPAEDSLVPRRCASSTSILHVNHAYPNLNPRPSLDNVAQHGRQHDHPDPHQQRQLMPSPSSSPPPPLQQQPQLTWKQPSLQRQNRKPPQRTNTHARLRQLMSNLSNEPRSQQHSQFSSGDQHSGQAPSSPAHSRQLNRILLPGDNGGGSGANRRQSSQQTFSRLSTFDETQGVPLDAAPAASPAYASLLPPGPAAGATGGGTLAQLRRTGLSSAVHKMSVCDKSVGSVAGFVAGPGWAMQACATAGNAAMEGAVWHRVQIRAVKERRGEQGAAGLGGRGDAVVANTSGAGADDNGVSQLLVVTQVDVTEHLLEYQPMARLLQMEHKVLESIFPRHCIEYLTQATGGPSGTSETPLRAPSGSTAAGDGSFGFPIASAAAAAAAAAGGDPTTAMPLVSYGDSAARLASLATAHSCITVLFCDIVGFTEMCHSASPFTVMSFLNDLYSRFDSLVDIYKVYKVETIGDCYMVAGGLVTYDEDGYKSVICNTEDPLHAVRTMEFAKAVLRVSREVRMPNNGQQVKLRVGLHSGPITSGVVGERMPRFCLFGDTVNVASRMESTCRPGCIHVSSTTRDRLPNEPWRDLGMTAVKGKGSMRTFEWGGDVEEPVQSDQLQRLLGLYL